MKEQSANKLDKLFKEKLQHAEISPEDNYWPFIEQKISKPSFLKFGWRHINIYNLSVGIILLSLTALLFLKNKPKENPLPIEPIRESTSINQNETTTSKESPNREPINSKSKISPLSKTENPLKIVALDSIPLALPASKKEPLAVVQDTVTIKSIEKKKRPKEIIYIIQQDTIIEKDTIKVRRLRKK